MTWWRIGNCCVIPDDSEESDELIDLSKTSISSAYKANKEKYYQEIRQRQIFLSFLYNYKIH